MAALLAACTNRGDEPAAASRDADSPAGVARGSSSDADPTASSRRSPWGARGEDAHRVVFADRSSQAYLLLLPPETASRAPSRPELRAMVEASFASNLEDAEVQLLLRLIDTAAPTDAAPLELDLSSAPASDAAQAMAALDAKDAAAMRRQAKRQDIIGLHVDLIDVSKVADAATLSDPVLARHLPAPARADVLRRPTAVLLRADYRSREAFRGLRLLQTLVRVYARATGSLILDPDTLETYDEASFSRARMRSAEVNLTRQVTVVPFPERGDAGLRVRLTTRGMRRFGCVDLELTDLPADPALLQQATDLIYAVAYGLIQTSEVDVTGVSLELEDIVTAHWRDAASAYEGTSRQLPRCDGCPETIHLHLVERPSLPTDPADHVVAQIVAPRVASDPGSYDHAAWVRDALARMFGPAPGADAPLP